MADTPIGALAVRIGADATDLVKEFGRAGAAANGLGKDVDIVQKSLARFAAVLAPAALIAWTKSIANAADEAGKTAQKVGMTVEAFSGLAYAARLANVSNEQFATGLKQLSKFMVENKVSGVSVEEQLLRISDEFSGAADDANKTAVAMKYFGKSGADLIPLLNQGRAGIEELRKEAHRLGVVISEEDAKAAEEFNDNLTRLGATVEGIARQMGGPLVKALGDTAGAFLQARKEGEGFFTAVARGIQILLTGTDADKWASDLHDMVDEMEGLKKARDKLAARSTDDPFFGTGGEFGDQGFVDIDMRIRELEKRIEKHRAIKRILLGEEGPAGGKPTGSVSKDGINEAALDEAIRESKAAMAREQEVRDVMHQIREADDKRELEQIAAQNKAKEDAELKAMEQRLLFREQELEREGEMTREAFEARMALQRQEQQMQAMRLGQAKTFFGNMSQLMQTNSKKQFEIGKQGAIAETVINTYNAAVGAYKAMASIPYVGPALGAAAAAAAIAFGTAQVNNIRKQSFGGGSVATPVFAANPSTGAPAGTPGDVGGGNRGPDTFINLGAGDMFSREAVRRLLKRLEEEGRDGGRIVVIEES